MNAIMSDLDFQRGTEPVEEKWQGLSELDRALAENRLTEYRLKKEWADPINRIVICAVAFLLAAFAVYVIIDDFVIRH